MQLTNENYFTPEADKEYMSVSQWKNFHGCLGLPPCEAKAMEKMNGTFIEEPSQAMIIGSYVDAYFEGTLDDFVDKHQEIFTKASLKKGEPELLSVYKKADRMIERCKRDPLFMYYMSGEKQTIFTAEMFGTKWKIKIDSYMPGTAIVDLKTVQDMMKIYFVKDAESVTFVEYWGYDFQLAVYQKVVELNTGEHLPCIIAGVSKEDVPDIELLEVPESYLRTALAEVEASMPGILEVKNGLVEPIGCGYCDYCKERKVLTEVIPFYDLLGRVT